MFKMQISAQTHDHKKRKNDATDKNPPMEK